MEEIRRYLLTVIITAFVCSILKRLLVASTALGKIVALICSVIITFAVISPLLKIDVSGIDFGELQLNVSAQKWIQEGQGIAEAEICAYIKDRTETYILDKASSVGAEIDVEVVVDTQTRLPESVVISGPVTPYAKSVLTSYMVHSLSLPQEMQQWN